MTTLVACYDVNEYLNSCGRLWYRRQEKGIKPSLYGRWVRGMVPVVWYPFRDGHHQTRVLFRGPHDLIEKPSLVDLQAAQTLLVLLLRHSSTQVPSPHLVVLTRVHKVG